MEIYEDSSPTAHTEIQNHYISFTLDYISQNYMNKIVQSEIADSLHISVRYLSNVWKNAGRVAFYIKGMDNMRKDQDKIPLLAMNGLIPDIHETGARL